MKKNNLRLLSILLSVISLAILPSCSDKGSNKDPLILPPNFEDMPEVSGAGADQPKKPTDSDTEKLRELLLKN